MPTLEEVTFFADGFRLGATLVLPDGGPHEGLPAIAFCDGWVAGNPTRTTDFARVFASRGFAALTFRYRGWLDSEGPRNRLFPLEQVADARAAVAYLQSRPEVDAGKVAIMGMLNGAGAALQAASEDEGIGAVVCLYPFGDGARWMRSLRRYHEWLELLDDLAEDRTERVRTGHSRLVDPSDILVRDPHALERQRAAEAASSERAAWRLSLESADALLAFAPEDSVHRISPRPVLCIAVEHDTLMPLSETLACFEALREPKELVVLRGISHFAIYEPEHLDPLLERAVTFVADGLGAPR